MIHDQRPNHYNAQNLSLQAVLGMLSWSSRLRAWLHAHAPSDALEVGHPSDVTYALLGLIACTERLEGLVPEPSKPETASVETPVDVELLDGILR